MRAHYVIASEAKQSSHPVIARALPEAIQERKKWIASDFVLAMTATALQPRPVTRNEAKQYSQQKNPTNHCDLSGSKRKD
ncbi:MAG: hypothetical protein LBE71_02680 [Dysgonamonadaceae bacterium]|nr:hypothetical protein [Dysgonamonadaceae bacterium]